MEKVNSIWGCGRAGGISTILVVCRVPQSFRKILVLVSEVVGTRVDNDVYVNLPLYRDFVLEI